MSVVWRKFPSGAEIMEKFGKDSTKKIFMHWKKERGGASTALQASASPPTSVPANTSQIPASVPSASNGATASLPPPTQPTPPLLPPSHPHPPSVPPSHPIPPSVPPSHPNPPFVPPSHPIPPSVPPSHPIPPSVPPSHPNPPSVPQTHLTPPSVPISSQNSAIITSVPMSNPGLTGAASNPLPAGSCYDYFSCHQLSPHSICQH
ncbi:hypothetical protein OS493_012834 [Desmophyllum pertusum]|uniref:Uncharacterized protein n=1 Tax=Desmophyllum pertusum TaxID=174260 RepID=A0A9X0CRR9_9CNID|nr:hypothetical protein OS493_012834 [Desmophyllum pertusum]